MIMEVYLVILKEFKITSRLQDKHLLGEVLVLLVHQVLTDMEWLQIHK